MYIIPEEVTALLLRGKKNLILNPEVTSQASYPRYTLISPLAKHTSSNHHLKDQDPYFKDLFTRTKSIPTTLQLITLAKFYTRHWMLYGDVEEDEKGSD